MEPTTFPVDMSDNLPCGRPIYAAPTDCDEQPVCLMHSRDPNKPQDEFKREVEAILADASAHHRPRDRFDFHGFAFLVADFRKETFAKNADFGEATFTKTANFSGATFTEEADFSRANFTKKPYFRMATFAKNVDVSWTTFTEGAIFGQARFARTADFGGATFTEDVNFHGATFSGEANFGEATFTKGAYFYGATFIEEASFHDVTFTTGANFSRATFTERANFFRTAFTEAANFAEVTFIRNAGFSGATFCDAAFFDDAAFGPRESALITGAEIHTIADFRDVRFLKPELVRFLRTNGSATEGLRVQFVNCHVEKVQFDAVRWHQYDGRMVLQDELDILDKVKDAPSYEETAIAYRRLIINSEKARAYDLAEDCTIGEFEMRRRDPSRFPFVGVLDSTYERFPILRRWIGEQVSVVGIYRLASIYGTSYQRAAAVLLLLILGFALVFSTIIGIHPHPLPLSPVATSTCKQSNPGGALCAGLLHAFEVATLQKDVLYKPNSSLGRIVEIFEQVFIAGQVALLLFALRRRFRR